MRTRGACPKDQKKCYVHHNKDGFPERCRHGNFTYGAFCPFEMEHSDMSALEDWLKFFDSRIGLGNET